MYSMLVTEGSNDALGVNTTNQFILQAMKKFIDSTKYEKYNYKHI